VARAGVRPAGGPGADASDRVRRILPRLSGTTPDPEIALALLTAAASGALRERLTSARTRHVRAPGARRSAARAARSAPWRSPASLAIALAGVIVLAIGVTLASRSVRSSGDYFVDDLQTAAISSGIVMLVSAVWFTGTEIVPNPWSGSRAGGWGWGFYLALAAFSCAAIGAVLFRFRDQSQHGDAWIGLVAQCAALAILLVGFLAARRNRAEAEERALAASRSAPEDERARRAARLRRDTARAIAKASGGDLDRPAAMEGLRVLYTQGRLPPERTEAVLRQLG